MLRACKRAQHRQMSRIFGNCLFHFLPQHYGLWFFGPQHLPICTHGYGLTLGKKLYIPIIPSNLFVATHGEKMLKWIILVANLGFLVADLGELTIKTSSWQPKWFIYTISHYDLQRTSFLFLLVYVTHKTHNMKNLWSLMINKYVFLDSEHNICHAWHHGLL